MPSVTIPFFGDMPDGAQIQLFDVLAGTCGQLTAFVIPLGAQTVTSGSATFTDVLPVGALAFCGSLPDGPFIFHAQTDVSSAESGFRQRQVGAPERRGGHEQHPISDTPPRRVNTPRRQ